MKLVKLLIVPAMLLLTVALAVPAFAHSATITDLKASCSSDKKVCFDFDVKTRDFDANGRDVLVDLVDTKQNKVLETLKEHLSQDSTHVHDCFTGAIAAATALTIRIRVPQGSDLELGDSKTSVDTAGCVSSSPSPTATSTPSGSGGGSPSPSSSSATTTVALAQTGGLDFRFPLIGLVLLVAGGTLYVVSASRGRSAGSK